MPKHLATWRSDLDCWVHPTEDQLFELLVVFSETFPTSGMTRAGSAYELPTSALLTDVSVSSSQPLIVLDTPDTAPEARNLGSNRKSRPAGLGNQVSALPTPRATRGGSHTESVTLLGTPRVAGMQGHSQVEVDAGDPKHRLEVQAVLLKTPTSQLAENGGSQHPEKRKAGGHGPTLADEVEFLLPTPLTRDVKDHKIARNPARPDDVDTLSRALATDGVLLPTPTTALSAGGQTSRGGKRSDELLLSGIAEQLLPTPRATDGTKGGPNQRGSSGDMMLPSAVMHLSEEKLLPTPTAMDAKASGGSSPGAVTLTDATVRTQLGARTNPRFDGGSKSQDDESLPPPSLDEQVSPD